MKKVLSMLLFVAAAGFAISCDPIEELEDELEDALEDLKDDLTGDLLGNETDGMTEYIGEVTVSNNFSQSASFFAEEDDDVITIVMTDIQFNAYMPLLDITLSDIEIDDDGLFELDTIEPSIVYLGASYPNDGYTVTDVSGSFSDDTLVLEFSCMGCVINFTGSAK